MESLGNNDVSSLNARMELFGNDDVSSLNARMESSGNDDVSSLNARMESLGNDDVSFQNTRKYLVGNDCDVTMAGQATYITFVFHRAFKRFTFTWLVLSNITNTTRKTLS